MKRTVTTYGLIKLDSGWPMRAGPMVFDKRNLKALLVADQYRDYVPVKWVGTYDDGKPAKPFPRRAKLAKPVPDKSGASGNPSPQSAARRKAIMLTPPAKRGGTKGKGGAK